MKFSVFLAALVVQVSAALKTLDQSTLGVKTKYEEPAGGCTLDSFACPDAQATLPTAPETGDYVNPAKDSYTLTAANFSAGTLRLTEPGIYALIEDITFEPQAANNWWPDCPSQAAYCTSKAYRLGFFAALTLEGSDIVLDLGGHTIGMSDVFALQQRFFSVIELADQTFIPKSSSGTAASQGPANFGSEIASCKRCVVKNGVIGRSSHHSIHGNRNEDIVISDVTFQDYEVAAISLNGAQRVLIENCHINGQSEAIPVRASYSAGRFINKFWEAIKKHITVSAEAAAEIDAASSALQVKMDEVLAAVRAGEAVTKESHPEFGLPVSSKGTTLADGNAYGITIHGDGVLVGAFGSSMFDTSLNKATNDITIRNTDISNVNAKVNEVVTVRNEDNGGLQTDVAGSLVRIDEIINADTSYAADTLHDMRFAMAYWMYNDEALMAAKGKYLGTFNIDLRTTTWARGEASAYPFKEGIEGDFACNGDSMDHRQKGTVGLFIQQANRVTVENVVVKGVSNDGFPGSEKCGNYASTAGFDEDAAFDNENSGYTGSQSRGVAITTSRNVVMRDVTVAAVESTHATACGIHIFNDVDGACLQNVVISETQAVSSELQKPNDPSKWQGYVTGERVSHITTIEMKFEYDR